MFCCFKKVKEEHVEEAPNVQEVEVKEVPVEEVTEVQEDPDEEVTTLEEVVLEVPSKEEPREETNEA
jgi:hypothetical protein